MANKRVICQSLITKVENLQDELYDIRFSEFDNYKEEKIKSLRDMINPEDSAEVKAIIEQAIKEIEAIEYDKTINLTTNEEYVNKLVAKAQNDIDQQRELEKQQPIESVSAQTGDIYIALACFCILLLLSASVLVARRETYKL